MSQHSTDPHHLERFLIAQAQDYQTALLELCAGRKRTHWIWYVFPQLSGLGRSSMAQEYAIRSKAEAIAYLQHEILGVRLKECSEALLPHRAKRIEDIMGDPDDLKLKSSLTLFAAISLPNSVFHQLLAIFYRGEMDSKTVDFLAGH